MKSYAEILQPKVAELHFESVTIEDMPILMPYIEGMASRSCDFTMGGLVMWAPYFHYQFAIAADTLYIKGVSEDDINITAFLPPIGPSPMAEKLEPLVHYCRRHHLQPLLTAVPDEILATIAASWGATHATELEAFADYIYDIQALATLSGKRLGKKRNHVNRFMADNPGYTVEPISRSNTSELQRFLHDRVTPKSAPSALFEYLMTRTMLRNWTEIGMEGLLLRTPDGRIAAFTIGEVKGDTLHVHVEKIDHTIDGAGEMINRTFCAEMLRRRPHLRYVNRQDDAGDPGLRAAKLSYHPTMLLRKYNITLD